MFVLGPESVISQQVLDQLKKSKLARSVNRIEGPTPVENAIAFARYEKGGFGWGVVVPGYNFTIASSTRPSTPAAAALGTRGVFAPLLLTDDADELPPKLEEYLLTCSPATRTTPARRLQPRLDARRRQGDLGAPAGARSTSSRELVPVQSNAP